MLGHSGMVLDLMGFQQLFCRASGTAPREIAIEGETLSGFDALASLGLGERARRQRILDLWRQLGRDDIRRFGRVDQVEFLFCLDAVEREIRMVDKRPTVHYFLPQNKSPYFASLPG